MVVQGAAVTLTELGEYSRAVALLQKLAKVVSRMLLLYLMSRHLFHKDMLI